MQSAIAKKTDNRLNSAVLIIVSVLVFLFAFGSPNATHANATNSTEPMTEEEFKIEVEARAADWAEDLNYPFEVLEKEGWSKELHPHRFFTWSEAEWTRRIRAELAWLALYAEGINAPLDEHAKMQAGAIRSRTTQALLGSRAFHAKLRERCQTLDPNRTPGKLVACRDRLLKAMLTSQVLGNFTTMSLGFGVIWKLSAAILIWSGSRTIGGTTVASRFVPWFGPTYAVWRSSRTLRVSTFGAAIVVPPAIMYRAIEGELEENRDLIQHIDERISELAQQQLAQIDTDTDRIVLERELVEFAKWLSLNFTLPATASDAARAEVINHMKLEAPHYGSLQTKSSAIEKVRLELEGELRSLPHNTLQDIADTLRLGKRKLNETEAALWKKATLLATIRICRQALLITTQFK